MTSIELQSMQNHTDAFNIAPETEAEYQAYSHFTMGVMYMLQAYMPVILWYSWRFEVYEKENLNDEYLVAWNFMWITHLLVNQLRAFLFPFTYLQDEIVNRFYIRITNTLFITVPKVILAVITAIIFANGYEQGQNCYNFEGDDYWECLDKRRGIILRDFLFYVILNVLTFFLTMVH